MYAVIKTGGKQYTVQNGSVLEVEKLDGQTGDFVSFKDVILVNHEGSVKLGAPFIEGAEVKGSIVAQTKGDKLISFKKWRRNGKQWKKGHRQKLTRVQINEIVA